MAKPQIKDDTKKMAHTFARVFKSPDGKIVLDHLRLIFKDQMLARGSEFETVVKASQADVVLQIESMIRLAENEKSITDEVTQ